MRAKLYAKILKKMQESNFSKNTINPKLIGNFYSNLENKFLKSVTQMC